MIWRWFLIWEVTAAENTYIYSMQSPSLYLSSKTQDCSKPVPFHKIKIFLEVTRRTQFLLDIIYHSHLLSFILGKALIGKSLTLEWLHGPAWGGCYWPHSVWQTKPTQIRERALICGTLCLSSLKSSFSPFSCAALSPVHKCWWFNGFWVVTLPHSEL